MRKLLLISMLAACPGAALAAESAACDAKPFTLNKPKPAAQKPKATSTADAAKTKPATPKATPKANAAAAKPIADCKESERKKG